MRQSYSAPPREKFDPVELLVTLKLRVSISQHRISADPDDRFSQNSLTARQRRSTLPATRSPRASSQLIVIAMGHERGFCSHAFSFFQCPLDIWPQGRLDDGATCARVNCSVVATHLARMEDPPPFSKPEEIAAEANDATETIELVDDMLANLQKSLSRCSFGRSVRSRALSIRIGSKYSVMFGQSQRVRPL
jgi:hypothetical protein